MTKRSFLFFVIFIVLLTGNLLANVGAVAGKVTTENNEPIPNANIVVLDTEQGVRTRTNGSYYIQNLPVGEIRLKASFIGYEAQVKNVEIKKDETTKINFKLKVKAIEMEGVKVTANKAVKRETPVAFTELDQEELQKKYTTEDMPMLIDDIPGVFSSTEGLGESDVSIRGFDSDKIQILINGIPVNDPESQKVYWSNWTGLSSNVKSVQVQRGAGSSLYGSGAFGGSLNIETIGSDQQEKLTIRTSTGYYFTQGVESGPNEDLVADGEGDFEEYNPMNYNLMLKYNSGPLKNGKYNYNLMFERKAGDYYINGTTYDGYSFGMELQTVFLPHKLMFSFIGAPQSHNQASSVMDMELLDSLGREYNRRNHEWQENFYFKPQWSIRDEWQISDNQVMLTNLFFTFGGGGGQYLRNDIFDVETGEISPLEVDETTTETAFGEHARWIHEMTGVVLDGYDPEMKTFNGDPVNAATNLISGRYDHSFKNVSYNKHTQFGLNTYYDHEINERINFVLGGEIRNWNADHIAVSENFRYFNPDEPNNVGVYDKTQRRYDYSSNVLNLSAFTRLKLNFFDKLHLLGDLQFASYSSEVNENPIHIFDYQAGTFLDETYYSTKSLKDEEGNYKFENDDYEKTYQFISPKAGVNYNLSEFFNVRSNFSIAYKEPRVRDWYNVYSGPNQDQVYETAVVKDEFKELEPEKAMTVEFGSGYDGYIIDLDANFYYTLYSDKIERIEDEKLGTMTINAGKAVHSGIELSGNFNYKQLDGSVSTTIAQNRWKSMKYDKIFDVDADLVKDKVVPFSPEKMANASLGYSFEKFLPEDQSLRLEFRSKWWDDYYASYTNEYKVLDNEGNLTITKEAKLPYFFQVDSSINYGLKIMNKSLSIKLDFNNILNKENYSRAYWSSDYGRNDNLNGYDYIYVSPAPLFNVFLTTEITL